MKNKFSFLAISLVLASSAIAAPMPPMESYPSQMGGASDYLNINPSGEDIVINNRVLIKLSGKPITVMDVVRKMDMHFYRQYPEHADSLPARYQFYMVAWKSLMMKVIDEELMLADAEEKQITVNDGEVREELDKLFGPDVVLSMDEAGMTFQESWDILKTELIVQKMNAIMVRSRAQTSVHPKDVRLAYQKMLRKQPPESQWSYQTISFRGNQNQEVADIAHQQLKAGSLSLDELKAAFEGYDVKIAISKEFVREQREIAKRHLEVLKPLSSGEFSEPIAQKGVTRLFYVNEFQEATPIAFSEVEAQLKGGLQQEAIADHAEKYRLKLHNQYGLSEPYLENLVPNERDLFALK